MKLKGDVLMVGNMYSLSILLSTIAMTILLGYLWRAVGFGLWGVGCLVHEAGLMGSVIKFT